MNTTGRWSAGICAVRCQRSSSADGMRSPSTPMSLSIAPVHPDPAKTTTVSASPCTASAMIRRASSRSRVVCSPVPLDSVWVLAYPGSTSSRMKSSMNVRARPDAV